MGIHRMNKIRELIAFERVVSVRLVGDQREVDWDLRARTGRREAWKQPHGHSEDP